MSEISVKPVAECVPNPKAQEVVLRLQDLGKEYRLYDSPRARLKALVLGGRRYRSHWVLRDVSFELKRGQCMGVVGNNGAGKSSLLKLIAGTIRPSHGVLHRMGRVTAILELGAGFHPDFTGRENLFYAGRLIGISDAELQRLSESIIAFSELGEAIDRPVKSYSSGMVVRLAFALVTAVEPDVLIVDEALAVGDQHFQKKCVERIEEFRRNGCTILFCSHSMYHVRHLCDVALWLENGQVRALGDAEQVIAAYEAQIHLQDQQTLRESQDMVQAHKEELAKQEMAAHPEAAAAKALESDQRAQILSFEIAHLAPPEGEEPPLLLSSELSVTLVARGVGTECPHMAIMLEQAKGAGVTTVATHVDGVQPTQIEPGVWRATVTFPDSPLHSGHYVLSAFLFDSAGFVVYDEWLRGTFFKVVYPSMVPGLVRLPHFWS